MYMYLVFFEILLLFNLSILEIFLLVMYFDSEYFMFLVDQNYMNFVGSIGGKRSLREIGDQSFICKVIFGKGNFILYYKFI